jgi:site-specific DNA-methyltransferase (adenine-specific)
VNPYYADDSVTLYGGDALAVLRYLPSGSVAAIIADPPYSSGGQYKGDRSAPTGTKCTGTYGTSDRSDFSGDNRDQRSFLTWMNLWLGEALRVVKPGGVCALFSDWRQLPTMTDALQVGGWVWRGIVPWDKTSGRPMYKQRAWVNQCEYVVWGTAGSSAVTEMGTTEPLPGFYVATAPREREHQTQKPVSVLRELVKIVPEAGLVMDPFMGSGTTGVAAMLEGRRFLGVELVENYQRIAERRIREAQGQTVARGAQSALNFGEASA